MDRTAASRPPSWVFRIDWQVGCRSPIRLEHECTHYFTRRLFGSAKNHLLDELIADYRGIVAAIGQFRADWFLRFMGLENYPNYRACGRLGYYRGDPPLSEQAFGLLQTLVQRAAENVERFDRENADRGVTPISIPTADGTGSYDARRVRVGQSLDASKGYVRLTRYADAGRTSRRLRGARERLVQLKF